MEHPQQTLGQMQLQQMLGQMMDPQQPSGLMTHSQQTSGQMMHSQQPSAQMMHSSQPSSQMMPLSYQQISPAVGSSIEPLYLSSATTESWSIQRPPVRGEEILPGPSLCSTSSSTTSWSFQPPSESDHKVLHPNTTSTEQIKYSACSNEECIETNAHLQLSTTDSPNNLIKKVKELEQKLDDNGVKFIQLDLELMTEQNERAKDKLQYNHCIEVLTKEVKMSTVATVGHAEKLDQVTQELAHLKCYCKEELEKIENEFDKYRGQIENDKLQCNYYIEVLSKKVKMSTVATVGHAEKLDQVTQEVAHLKCYCKEELEKIENEFDKHRGQIENEFGKYRGQIENEFGKYRGQIENEFGKYRGQIENELDKYRGQIEAVRISATKRDKFYQAQLDENKEQLDNCQNVIGTLKEEIENEFDKYRGQIENEFDKYRGLIENEFDKYRGQIEAVRISATERDQFYQVQLGENKTQLDNCQNVIGTLKEEIERLKMEMDIWKQKENVVEQDRQESEAEYDINSNCGESEGGLCNSEEIQASATSSSEKLPPAARSVARLAKKRNFAENSDSEDSTGKKKKDLHKNGGRNPTTISKAKTTAVTESSRVAAKKSNLQDDADNCDTKEGTTELPPLKKLRRSRRPRKIIQRYVYLHSRPRPRKIVHRYDLRFNPVQCLN